MRDRHSDTLRRATRAEGNFTSRDFVQRGDDDLFRVRLGSRSSLSVDLSRMTTRGEIEVYQPTGRSNRSIRQLRGDFGDIRSRRVDRFLHAAASSKGRNPAIEVVLEPGLYFFHISSSSGRGTRYQLRLTANSIVDAPPANGDSEFDTSLNLYDGVGLLSEEGTLVPTQLPLPEAQALAVGEALGIPPSSIPEQFIAPREAREAIATDGTGTTLNTELFDGEGTGVVGYQTHTLTDDFEVLALVPVPIIRAGLAPINPDIVLDQSSGYRVEFDLAIDRQLNAGSGFNVTTISSDGQTGIELAWTPSGIVAVNQDLSETGEQVAFETTVATSYALTVQGDTYFLEAAGQEVLSGSLRDYDSSTVVANSVIPYDLYSTSNFLFLGDSRDLSSSIFTLDRVDLFY